MSIRNKKRNFIEEVANAIREMQDGGPIYWSDIRESAALVFPSASAREIDVILERIATRV